MVTKNPSRDLARRGRPTRQPRPAKDELHETRFNASGERKAMRDDDIATTKPEHVTSGNGIVPDFGAWLTGHNPVLESWAELSAGMMKSATEISQEMMTFSQNQLRADMDAWKAVASCRDPGELFACQREFAEKATAQYFDEASKLTSRILTLMSDAAASFQQGQAPKA
jgi:hypothetical protein